MLPPVEPAVLERNPNFEVLYKDLCARKLNPDGSTRDTKKQRMHAEIRQVRRKPRAGSFLTLLPLSHKFFPKTRPDVNQAMFSLHHEYDCYLGRYSGRRAPH